MQRFLPGRHLIESFGNGGFRLGGVSHLGSIIITPSGVRATELRDISDLQLSMLQVILDEAADIDMLLIGTGRDMAPLSKPVAEGLKNASVGYEVMTTNAAVRTYNVVLAEDRRVAAVMLAVDKAYG
jgi:uncharacterized protein